MSKAADAFRTISEVADDLEVPKHVLRFWENRFPQIKPMKRGGGRRYYRPADLDLLRGIRHLLHNEGFTIKGVQKILREQGVETVKSCWQGGGKPEKSVTLPGPAAKRGANADREAKRGKATRAPAKLDRKALLLRIAEELRTCRAILAGEESTPSVPRRASARR